jgi:serine/threonine protein kinase
MCLPTASPERQPGSERRIPASLGRARRARAGVPAVVMSSETWRRETRLAANSLTEVWLVREPGGRQHVVKCPNPANRCDRRVARLIEREWEFLQAGASPGVVEAQALERSERGTCLVTEYLPNGDIVALTGSHPRCWVTAMRSLAGTLVRLHERGVVHRDVKPRNVLFDINERATLIDFASAARCGERPPAGGTTAAYRAPGGQRGAVAAPAEDEFAYAAVLYELLAGEPPFAPRRLAESDPAFAPLRVERLVFGEESGIRDLVGLVNVALEEGTKEPRPSLAVFQRALTRISPRSLALSLQDVGRRDAE